MDAQAELELLNRFSVVLPWILWRLPLAAMLVIWAVCVVRHPQRRRALLASFAAAAALAAVLFGGRWLLEQNGLTYRTWLLEGLSIVLWAAGLALGILTVRHFHGWLKETRPKLAPWGMALGLYCLVCVMLSGTVLGGLWAIGPGEEVGFYHGRQVVQGRWTWMETSYDLYEYHGPLVRGVHSIAWGEEPLLGG